MGQEFDKILTFQDEDAERVFWATHDSADYLDWDAAEEIVLPELRPTTQTISLRLSRVMLDELRLMANKRDISYQALIKASSRNASTRNFSTPRGDNLARHAAYNQTWGG